MSLLIGIDPSLCCTGWITLDGDRIAFGAVVTEPEQKKRHVYKSDDTTRRLVLILDAIDDATDQLGVPQVACEQPAGAQSAAAASALGEVHGALVGLFRSWGLLDDVRWIPASDGKRALTGHKSASKRAMIEAADRWLCAGGYVNARHEFAALTKRAREAVADALGVLLASGLVKKGNVDGGAA